MDISAVEKETQGFLDGGMRVMNAFLLADNEVEHAAALLDSMAPPVGATVLDAGCGVGAVAELMHDIRSDLQFKLLNVSRLQLDHCPSGMERIHGDYDAVPLPDASVDVVMFNFSICHANDWQVTLREARRVLREGGTLFIFDMVRRSGDNALMSKILAASAYPGWQIAEAGKRAGFRLDRAEIHQPKVERLRDVMGDGYDSVVGDVLPATFRFVRETVIDPVASAFARHDRIAFQFSGGRDSTAALYLLRPYWDRMSVYHLDTGDQFPETQAVVRKVESDMAAEMIRIVGDVEAVRRDHGFSSDVIPVDNTELGRKVSGRSVKIIGRYECCARALMQPMHDRMIADGITLIVRGQRDDEYSAPPMRSGQYGGGFEVLYPIQSWSASDVDDYLSKESLPVAPFYSAGMKRAPECMGCTAWWDEGRAAYLKQNHPVKFEAYRSRMTQIRAEIDRQYQMLEN
ncbi:MAG: methyltransferase domain-containing protein [Rhizobacter sp.]